MTQPVGVVQEALPAIQETFSGDLLQPGDAAYEEARKIHNGLVDKRPVVIARCQGVADVVDAVTLGQSHGLEVSVRGGGHNVAGRAVTDGGLMIDLTLMKGIHVDPVARTARAQPGLTWGEFNRETQIHGLATTGGVVSSTGIAGLTLGGGLGYLMGKHGLAADNLLSAEVVTADARVLEATADEADDLFWGLRGGGGNFGVVTSFEYRLHPVGPVTGGRVVHPIERARDVLHFYRDFSASLPDELVVFAGLNQATDGSGEQLVAIIVCHCGSLREGAAAVAPIKEFGAPLIDTIGPMPYSEINRMSDAGFPRGALNYWKSRYLRELSDDAIDTMIEQFRRSPSPMSGLLLEHVHGAATRIGATETAFPHRETGYNLLIFSEWLQQADTDRGIAWARETYNAVEPFMAAGRYVNYLAYDESGSESVAAAYGPNYERLRDLKTKFDPANFFRMNQNIPPRS